MHRCNLNPLNVLHSVTSHPSALSTVFDEFTAGTNRNHSSRFKPKNNHFYSGKWAWLILLLFFQLLNSAQKCLRRGEESLHTGLFRDQPTCLWVVTLLFLAFDRKAGDFCGRTSCSLSVRQHVHEALSEWLQTDRFHLRATFTALFWLKKELKVLLHTAQTAASHAPQ